MVVGSIPAVANAVDRFESYQANGVRCPAKICGSAVLATIYISRGTSERGSIAVAGTK
jgi:hypothetical protein